ncbi:MAG TPA: DUF3343 domain-containing protein [bacterium]|jgi:hypothetical protein|nr:DUF3343 domain-containing protein [bacterium]HNW15531.1 DUF3343 domain-containing protein [bacterium]HOB71355.1 DUF3343 domain-containing protein [bacterium]HOG43728.1 DUF3343 domain-containing protein [bacterium]HPA57851.1 DUF3343 domain-containing protein [bacterium]
MILFLFENTRSVIVAEEEILKKKVKCRIIPVPRSISSQCGLAIEAELDSEIQISGILTEKQIKFDIYREYKK